MPDMLCFALTLTGTPGSRSITAEVRARAEQALDRFQILQTYNLVSGDAWRALFVAPADSPITAMRQRAAGALDGFDLDVNITGDDLAYTKKRVLVADMESTIIQQEMLDELGDLIGKRGVIEDITARAMRGELDFEAALKERVAMLAGLDASVLDEVSQRITYMPGARELVSTMKANGAWCALVSGGFTCFTERVARELGFDEHQANTLEVVDGQITGRVIEPILGRAAKLDALVRIAAAHDVHMVQTLAVGDGANDLAMLSAAGLGVAFRAKPAVREAALANAGGAVVTHGDLTALLHLQGYAGVDARSA